MHSEIGAIEIEPNLTGYWDPEGLPEHVTVYGLPFRLTSLALPQPGVIAHYREVADTDSMHLYVYSNRTWRITHIDEYHPEKHPLKHWFEDVVPNNPAAAFLTGMGVGLLAFGLATGFTKLARA